MRRKAVRIVVIGLGLLTLVFAGLSGWARYTLERSYAQVPYPTMVADTSPQGVERGDFLFNSLCMECHGGSDGRATGKHLAEVPAFLGKLYSANLAHPQTGVLHRSDAELARVLRNGVLPDGRLSVLMNSFGHLGDRDVSAILGYIRSRPPVFEPAGEAQPRSEISLAGALILTYVAQVETNAPASGIPVPPKAVSLEYGRYMAQTLDCVGCHTDGFGSDKFNDPGAFAGGMEMTDPTGLPIYTRNLTPDPETGIGKWTLEDFRRAVTRGVRPEGTMVRKPMPLFSRLDAVDTEALYTFLRSVPAVHRPNKPGGHALERAEPGTPAETLFVSVGCASCHGPGAPYREKLAGALEKSDAEIAAWILDPQKTKPGSIMPSFETVLQRPQAEALARYVRTLAQPQQAQAPGTPSAPN